MDAAATIKALSQQKHSLRSLAYARAGHYTLSEGSFILRMLQRREPGVDAGFADFHRLESVTCIGACSQFEQAVLSTQSPPNLRTLVYQAENPITTLRASSRDTVLNDSSLATYLPFLRAPSASVPACLETLHIVYQSRYRQPLRLSDYMREHIQRLAKALSKVHGASLTVAETTFGRYFPPFLYGEPTPKERAIYEGASDEFVDGGRERDQDWNPGGSDSDSDA